MPDLTPAALVSQIHAGSTRLVLAITGGGSRAISELLAVPGASRTLLEAIVPYSPAALHEWLSATPENFCSERTARAMAMAGFLHAHRLVPHAERVALAGVGCTASLVSDRPKRGAHRVHVAWQSKSATVTYSVELVKGRRNRVDEEELSARLVLNAAAEASGIDARLPLGTQPDEPLAVTRTEAPPAWQDLLTATRQAVRHEDGTREGVEARAAAPTDQRRALFPGAFHPLHGGHRGMAEIAATALGLPVEFEISIENVDKPPLDFTEMDERLRQFAGGQSLWFTRAPTFERKSELFANTTFIVGADTIRRIADPRYYNDNPALAAAAIGRIAKRGGRFLVFGRASDGHFETLEQLHLPAALRAICTEVAPDQFRHDVSSTTLRVKDEG